jgi:hypothetical protein
LEFITYLSLENPIHLSWKTSPWTTDLMSNYVDYLTVLDLINQLEAQQQPEDCKVFARRLFGVIIQYYTIPQLEEMFTEHLLKT